MSKALLYPQYLPDALELRINLLLNDSVATIVPSADQSRVLRRPQIIELIDYLPDGSVTFFDPSFRYGEWFESDEMKGQLSRIVSPIERSSKHKDLWIGVTLDQDGNFADRRISVTMTAKLRGNEHGWVYLASQKFPGNLLTDLFSRKLAVRAPILNHEAYPVLVHPRVGGFILSQLARNIACLEKVKIITSDTSSFKDSLFEVDQMARPSDREMMALMLRISLPETIGAVKPEDFMEARREFRKVRENLREIIDGVTSRFELEGAANIIQFREFISDKSSEINTAISDAHRAIKFNANKNKLIWGVSAVSSVAIAGAAAVFGEVQGAGKGAMIGAAITPVVATIAQRLSTSTIDQHNGGVVKIATLKTALERRQTAASFLAL